MNSSITPSPDAENLARDFKEFVYIVSHDLSAPLRAIVEFSRLLQDEQRELLNEDGKEYLSLIMESGEKLQKMLAGLLDYSRLDTMSKPFSQVNCTSVLNDCRIVLQDTINLNEGNLQFEAMPTITADAEQLMQLFLTLLENAFKFQHASNIPQISVSCQKSENEWIFTVRDNGIGIEREFHKRVFQPFQRLHTDKEYPGVGMGLALAKKIVSRHGGKIWIDSTVGKGSSFMFSMPERI